MLTRNEQIKELEKELSTLEKESAEKFNLTWTDSENKDDILKEINKLDEKVLRILHSIETQYETLEKSPLIEIHDYITHELMLIDLSKVRVLRVNDDEKYARLFFDNGDEIIIHEQYNEVVEKYRFITSDTNNKDGFNNIFEILSDLKVAIDNLSNIKIDTSDLDKKLKDMQNYVNNAMDAMEDANELAKNKKDK